LDPSYCLLSQLDFSFPSFFAALRVLLRLAHQQIPPYCPGFWRLVPVPLAVSTPTPPLLTFLKVPQDLQSASLAAAFGIIGNSFFFPFFFGLPSRPYPLPPPICSFFFDTPRAGGGPLYFLSSALCNLLFFLFVSKARIVPFFSSNSFTVGVWPLQTRELSYRLVENLSVADENPTPQQQNKTFPLFPKSFLVLVAFPSYSKPCQHSIPRNELFKPFPGSYRHHASIQFTSFPPFPHLYDLQHRPSCSPGLFLIFFF